MESQGPKTLVAQIRENLLLGLVSLGPLAVTLWVLFSVVHFLDNAMYSLFPTRFEPKNLLGVNVPGLGIVITFLLLLMAGTVARTVSGKVLQSLSDSFWSRVPGVRGLYNLVKQMSTIFFSGDSSNAFSHVVLVPFPSPASKTLGFVTGAHSESETMVFIPTAPNPTSGYVVIYKNSDIEESHLEVDEALKLILSCGAVGKAQAAPGTKKA